MSDCEPVTAEIPESSILQAGPGARVRVLLGADRPILRAALRKLLDAEPGYEVIAEAPTLAAASILTRELAPDIVLLDVPFPAAADLEAIRQIAGSVVPCRIVLLTTAMERAHVVEALRCGARGVLTKETTTDLLFKSIRCVMANQYWVGRESVADLVQHVHQATPAGNEPPKKAFGLTRRERQILSTVASGCTNKDIAQQFSLSEDTVKHHVSNIFDKVGVSNRLELALFALHHGLTDPS